MLKDFFQLYIYGSIAFVQCSTFIRVACIITPEVAYSISKFQPEMLLNSCLDFDPNFSLQLIATLKKNVPFF